MSQDVYVAVWMETTPIGADFPHPEVAAVTFSFFLLWLLKHTEEKKKKRDKRSIIIQDHTSPPGLISFSSLSSLTHSRQLIILLFPHFPQCTCNYHSHACLPPASCPEGGVSFSLSLSVYLCRSSSFSSFSLLPVFPQLSFFLFSLSCVISGFLPSVCLYLSSTTRFSTSVTVSTPFPLK